VPRSSRFVRNSLVLALAIGVTACSSLTPQSFHAGTPTFEPDRFFEGPVRSWGVVERRSGKPSSRFRTETNGVREGESLVLTQHFFYEDGRTQQRVWRIHRINEHQYEATANDVVGVGRGEAYGNAFHWEYTLAARPGNPLLNVRMKHWMYLQPDGSMLNRVQVTKFGLILEQITEYFRRGAGPLATGPSPR
jgi:hypothetical protein